MRRRLTLFTILATLLTTTSAIAQKAALKSNLLYDATTTINLGVEFAFNDTYTLDLSGNYNGWKFGGGKQWCHWLIQPEARYWFDTKFDGHFVGVHAHVAGFNVAGLKMFGTKDVRHQGHLGGAGITYGYNWRLNDRWHLEAAVGVGYAYIDYEKWPCADCGKKLSDHTKHYFGPTKAALSLIYIFK